MNFRAKNKIRDAVTFQHVLASTDPKLSHCFFTLTYPQTDTSSATKDIGKFMQKLMKHSQRIYPVNAFSYVWVRELTGNVVDHFHCTCVLPVWPVPAPLRKRPELKYTIPVHFKDEMKSKYFTLNKSWCQTRGFYSRNGVRLSKDKRTGKTKFIVADLESAIKYVSGYMTKAKDTDTTRPLYRLSKNLSPWTQPVGVPDALLWAYHPFYGDEFKWRDKNTGELNSKKVIEHDYSKVGKVKTNHAFNVWQKLNNELVTAMVKRAQLNNDLHQKLAESGNINYQVRELFDNYGK